MAAKALDDPDPKTGTGAGLYWAGHEYLARSLGYDWPEDDEPESVIRRKGILRNVRRYVAVLIEAKAVELADAGQRAYPGRPLVYRLKVMEGNCDPPNGG